MDSMEEQILVQVKHITTPTAYNFHVITICGVYSHPTKVGSLTRQLWGSQEAQEHANKIKNLMSMSGCNPRQAEEALTRSGWNAERAAEVPPFHQPNPN